MEKNSSLGVPIAIVIAGLLVAGAVYFGGSKGGTPATPEVEVVKGEVLIPAVTSADHIVGNPDAPVVIVEYSDTECPFCKVFHGTLNRIMDTLGKEGKVAWVYRHFPLEQLHKKAPREAAATECAAKLGGNDGFWKFTNDLYNTTTSNDKLEDSELPKIAARAGLNVASFNACLSSGEFSSKVQGQYEDAIKAGGTGTPFSVLVSKKKMGDDFNDFLKAKIVELNLPPTIFSLSDDGYRLAASGALPDTLMREILDEMMK